MTDRKYFSNVLDVRIFRGPNIDGEKFQLAINTSRPAWSSPLLKLDVKKLRFQRTVEAFSAHFSDKLCRSPSNLSDIGELWANISHSLRTTAETVLCFQRPPHRNQWYDKECSEAAAAKTPDARKLCSQPLRELLSRTTKIGEGMRDTFSDARRGSRKGVSVRKSRCRNEARKFYLS